MAKKLGSSWGLFQTYPTEWHVHPVDEPDHVHCVLDCSCNPKLTLKKGINIIIHNSFDGREAVDMAYEILNNKN